MRFCVRTWAFFIAAVVSCRGVAAAPTPSRVRVLTYNIHHGEGTDGKLDLERIAAVITASKPDIVCLQEVDRKAGRSGRVDQAEFLAKRAGLSHVFGRAIPLPGGEYGNALLSRWPIVRHETVPLPLPVAGEGRSLIRADVRIPPRDPGAAGVAAGDGVIITILATHLALDEANRLAAAAFINARFAAASDAPALLAGDFNARPRSPLYQAITTKWEDTGWLRTDATHPAGRPKDRIDYVFYRPPHRWRVVEYRVLGEKVASDHRPILVVLELRDVVPADPSKSDPQRL